MNRIALAKPAEVVPLTDGGADRYRILSIRLPRLLAALRSAPPIQRGMGVPLPSSPGVYLLTEDGRPIYVGQTRNLRQRLAQHSRPSSDHNQASFAFTLARLEFAAGATIDQTVRRRALAADPAFQAVFRRMRGRVARMWIRSVSVDDPELRTVFEVYATIMLGTKNSFETVLAQFQPNGRSVVEPGGAR